jgi:predicted GIY-YIG superfamily endonuclease
MYILYKATSPSGRSYIGVTNNFKRRMKEHMSSKYPFGDALRKYQRHNFDYSFEMFDTLEDALVRESELVNQETLSGLYNQALGGSLRTVLLSDNPMHKQSVVESHPGIFSTSNNPMNNPESKQKMIKAQKRKRVSISGVEYDGVREAARQLGSYRQFVIHRLTSKNYTDWYYL